MGRWVDNQRTEYKKRNVGKPDARITQERIDALNSIGFEWYAGKSKTPKEDKLSVDEYSSYAELTPSRRSSRRTRIASTDRYSGDIPSAMSAKRPRSERRQSSRPKSRRLNDGSRKAVALQHNLGFEKDDESARFQEEIIPARARCLSKRTSIPTCHMRKRVAPTAIEPTKTVPIPNRCLRKRAAPTRTAGQLTNTVPERSSPRLNPGEQMRNTSERSVLGVDSAPRIHYSTGAKSIATATDISWDEHFDRLVEFKWNHGHCRVPVGFCVDDSYYLGQWVVVQRLQHDRLVDGRPSSITADQVLRLNAIGFVWRAR